MNRTILLAICAATLASCDREPKSAAVAPVANAASEAKGPVAWNESAGVFELAGQPLPTAKLWRFDGSTEGFTAVGSEIAPAQGGGIDFPITAPSLRSPKGLAIDGAKYPLVIVRLTRTAAGQQWDGALYFTSQKHPESGQYFGKPLNNRSPNLNETVTLVYDMSQLTVGGNDWQTSTVDQIRLDVEDKPGGRFVIKQIAIAENPNPAALPAAPKP